MRQLLLLGLWWSLTPLAWAGTGCFEKATNKLLEYQSAATPGICEQNWVTANPQYGFSHGQVEERPLSDDEARTLVKTANQALADPQKKKHAKVILNLCQGAGLISQDLTDCQKELE